MAAPPEKFVKNGKPVFGTFDGVPQSLDIRGVRRPFGVLPLPSFITDLRIRSSLACPFNIDGYIGLVSFLDLKVVGHGEVLFWSKRTGRKYVYHTVTGPRRRLISKNAVQGACISFSERRHIRIVWDMTKPALSLAFNLRGDSARPHVSGALKGDLSDPGFCSVSAVLPAPTMRRCRGIWMMSAPLAGTIRLESERNSCGEPSGQMGGVFLFKSQRSYNMIRTKAVEAWMMGPLGDRWLSFNISTSSLDAVDSNRYGENVLFYGGEATPLPPVKITFPLGLKEKWIIQDTENMVDLSFSPLSDYERTVSILFLRAQKRLMYGTFSGMLRTKDGEELVIKDFPGIARKSLMRL